MFTFIEMARQEQISDLKRSTAIKLLYQWVKTSVITVHEFERLLNCLKK